MSERYAVEDAVRPALKAMRVEVAFAVRPKVVEGVNGKAAPAEPVGVVVAMMVPLASTAKNLPAGVASGAIVTAPVLLILKSVEVADGEVEEPIANKVELVSP